MKSGTLEEIRDYIKDLKPLVTKEIKCIEDWFLKKDDSRINRIPIYFIKSRVKEPDSAFLKTKRKSKSYKDFTDYGGVRLLCLFERDMLSVHEYLLGSLSKNEFDLYECNFYNFDDNDELYKKLCQSIEQYYPGHFMIKEDKMSGYKSIHYLVCRDGAVVVEIQLRTLIQDVWGELEHALSYKKGRVNPYIKKSFELLAKELQNIDNMLSYLNDIALRENAGREYEKYKERPGYYAEYEDELVPDIFIVDPVLKREYEKYKKLTNNYLRTDEWANKARGIYKKICKIIEGKSIVSDSKLMYWLNMENAFIFFCEARYNDSFSLYGKVLKYCDDKYCVYYRLGELHFIYGRNDEALNYFDKADSILQGDEYIDVAVRQIEDAEQIYKKYNQHNNCDSKMHNVLLNL
jgi:ppGpp synthetase/RelA/SpoT-type nucleotidyltranferase